MKTFLIKLSPFALIAALMFSTSLSATPALDREPTSVEFLEGKVHRLSMELEEVRFQLKNKAITKVEKRQLKHDRRMLKRELAYNQELLSHARFPARYAYPGIYNPGFRYRSPLLLGRRPVVFPPSYRRPVVVVNRNNRSRTQGNQAPRRPSQRATPAPVRRPNRSVSTRVIVPKRNTRPAATQASRTASPRATKIRKR